MAVDVCSEISSTGISPRISFSYDLNQTDVLPIERSDLTLLDSSSDFVFCIGNNSFVQELSPADELFSNGKIRAKEIKKNVTTPDENEIRHSQSQSISSCSRSHQRSPSSSFTGNSEKKQLKEFLSNSIDMEDEKPASKSFWQFKRSSSLNCDSSRSRGLIRSLQFLSRSNSTGSSVLNSNSKKTTLNSTKETQKPHLQKQPSVSSRKLSSSSSSSSSCSSTYYFYSSSQRPSLKKNNSGSYGKGVRISPVLNLTPPYISRVTVSFFGFGSLFCNGKVKNKKK